MSEKMIINARHALGWRRLIFSDLSTLTLWCVWIYLWLPVFEKLREVIHLRLNIEPATIEVLETIDPISIRLSLVALLGTCASLLLWTLLPRRKVIRTHAPTKLADYAVAFDLPVSRIEAIRASRRTTVHHDEFGRIVGIDTQSHG